MKIDDGKTQPGQSVVEEYIWKYRSSLEVKIKVLKNLGKFDSAYTLVFWP